MAFTGLTTLSSCEKDTASPNDTLTFAELNAPYTALTPTVTPSGSVTFFARSTYMSSAGNSIDVFVDGSYLNSIFVTTNSGVTPACGLSGNVTTTLTAGTHSWFARAGNFNWSTSAHSINITSNVCAKQEVTSF